VQVDPVKPKLKLPGTKRLKLKCNILLSTSALKFNLRRYTVDLLDFPLQRLAWWRVHIKLLAGAHTRSHCSST
jgi:hypothetical protein